MGILLLPTLSSSVHELAIHSTTAVRILESFEIDYYCDPESSLEAACNRMGLAPESILQEIRAAIEEEHDEDVDWSHATLRDLIAHVVTTHHEYLKRELPRLKQELRKVYSSAPESSRSAVMQLPGLLDILASELEMHMHKEEMILFPYIEQYEAAAQAGRTTPVVPFGTMANPIAMMEHEHDGAIATLRSMRTSTGGYEVKHEMTDELRTLYAALEELERDLHVHIHLENNILFPRAIELEALNR